jgi:3-oxoacyl-(acyl-carrier-protein) synthase
MPPVSSTKSYTGHTTSASGSIEAIICLIAMQERFIPGNLGWQNGTTECIAPSAHQSEAELHNILCNSFGFGGNDSSLIISDKEVFPNETNSGEYTIIAESELHDEEELKELRQYVSPMESRRMCRLMKAAFLTSMRALETAGITRPDAIIVATVHGMLENGKKILDTLNEQGEEGISPTLFMQSTHNTLAGALAIHLGCHGYNITYSQGDESLQWAIRDAQRLIRDGKAETVLVGLHDEMPLCSRSIIIRKV